MRKGLTQEHFVLDYFRTHVRPATPRQVRLWICKKTNSGVLLTSVRRAMCDLSDRGLIFKTMSSRINQYGAKEHFWKKSNRLEMAISG